MMPLSSFGVHHLLHDMGLSLKSGFYLQRDFLGLKWFSFESHYQQEIVPGLGLEACYHHFPSLHLISHTPMKSLCSLCEFTCVSSILAFQTCARLLYINSQQEYIKRHAHCLLISYFIELL